MCHYQHQGQGQNDLASVHDVALRIHKLLLVDVVTPTISTFSFKLISGVSPERGCRETRETNAADTHLLKN
jgi:hypothetical protein